ncbi:ATP-binding protein [Halocalculus aciditolerans]|uniref:Nucleotidyltransferase n=1 Tax=Halocalculus aciditolerans TaxID=1383812 RepID=A0A830FMX7_9EURY|nr:DUF87 domain-containing protein [Halocalculus aciditolerans]GGL68689.1 nucleotidyltransferase [Halocalculus aciditolerans]
MDVIGRHADEHGPSVRLGHYLARDGSAGAPVGLDLDRPHAALVLGKRGTGKSHTLGVIAEGLARASDVTGVVVDPLGALCGLPDGVSARTIEPRIPASAVPPAQWPELLGLDTDSSAGSLVWRAASDADSLHEMRSFLAARDRPDAPGVRAARNHLALAADWNIFDADAALGDVLGSAVTVLDCTRLAPAARDAVVGALARALYEHAVTTDLDRLPWLLVDEAHVPFRGTAAPALHSLLTRGRAPGVSLVLATQRPSTLPPVAGAQADLLLAHHLSSRADRQALRDIAPATLDETALHRLPRDTGDALLVDDTTEHALTVRVRERHTPHLGDSPRASRR